MAPRVYRFEGIDEALDLVPLAGRRALDRAGRKLGLEAWRALSLEARTAIVEAGTAETVDGGRVLGILSGAQTSSLEARPEPDASVPPPLVVATGVTRERWARLSGLDRWALDSLAHRGRHETLAALLAELG